MSKQSDVYMIIRDEQIKMVITGDVRYNGELWVNGNPMIDSKSAAYIAAPDAIKAAQIAKEWDKIPAEAIAHIGTNNATGLTIIKQADYLAAKAAAITPAQRDRIEINKMYAKASAIEQSDSEDNVSEPMRIRSAARTMLAAWSIKYPADAAAEEKAKLISKAADLRSKAVGALMYDCDGSLSEADQQARHDDMIAQAVAIEAEAAKL